MDNRTKRRKSVFLPVIVLSITIGLFLAGLWPMNFNPLNKVAWLHDENGVSFQGFGMAYCPSPLIAASNALGHNGPITLELCVRPQSEPSDMVPRIISLYDGKEREVFLVGQWESHLIIRSRAPGRIGPRAFREIGLDNILKKGETKCITIASGNDGTLISVNGTRGIYFPGFTMISGENENSGLLILGNSPDGHNAWIGYLLSFAIYNRYLTDEEVSRHYENFVRYGNLLPDGENKPLMHYRFMKRNGIIARNLVGSNYDLLIPKFFHPLHKNILVPPWQVFQFGWSFFQDAVINILGFIPFGYFFASCFGNKKPRLGTSDVLIVILMGFGISLSIEIIQVYLPTRDSSLTDLISNTLGTSFGIFLSRCVPFLSVPR